VSLTGRTPSLLLPQRRAADVHSKDVAVHDFILDRSGPQTFIAWPFARRMRQGERDTRLGGAGLGTAETSSRRVQAFLVWWRPLGVIPIPQTTSGRLLVTHTNVNGPHALPVIWRFMRCRSLKKGAAMMGMRWGSSLAVLLTLLGGLLVAAAAEAQEELFVANFNNTPSPSTTGPQVATSPPSAPSVARRRG
jgi:hypothetical protein